MAQTFYSIHDHYISHHGVKGQKWGVRRYQNSDGSLTAEGKARYSKIQSKYKDKHTGKFSTEKAAWNDTFRGIGGGIAGAAGAYGTLGLAAAGATGGATLIPVLAGIGIALGTDVATVVSRVKRKNARNFALDTGMITKEQAAADLQASYTRAGGILGGAFGYKKAQKILSRPVSSLT